MTEPRKYELALDPGLNRDGLIELIEQPDGTVAVSIVVPSGPHLAFNLSARDAVLLSRGLQYVSGESEE